MDHRISDVFRLRLRDVREHRRLSRAELANRLREIGHPIEPLTLSRLETGRTKRVPLDDLIALAYALDVSPLFLILPYDTGEPIRFGEGELPSYRDRVVVAGGGPPVGHLVLRAWLRGTEPLPGQDVASFYRELPPDELAALTHAAREVEAGKPTLPGAPAIRQLLIEKGETKTVDSTALDAIRAKVNALSEAEVIAELGGDVADFERWLTETSRSAASRKVHRERTIADLRCQLIEGHVRARAHQEAVRAHSRSFPVEADDLPWKRRPEQPARKEKSP